jgi:NitT/TauT family transport system permease protein
MKRETLIRLLIVSAPFILWQVLGDFNIIPSYLLGTPIGALNALFDYIRSPIAIEDIETTLFEALSGLFIGIIFGISLGIIIGSSNGLSRIFSPIFSSLIGIPKVVFAPFVILAFGGISPISKIFLASYGSFLMVFHTVYSGMRVIDDKYLRLFEVYKASKLKVLTKLFLPYSLFWLISSLRLALPMAFTGSIVGEFLAGVRGLGVRFIYYESLFYPDGVLAVTFLIVAIIIGFVTLLQGIEKRALKWKK